MATLVNRILSAYDIERTSGRWKINRSRAEYCSTPQVIEAIEQLANKNKQEFELAESMEKDAYGRIGGQISKVDFQYGQVREDLALKLQVERAEKIGAVAAIGASTVVSGLLALSSPLPETTTGIVTTLSMATTGPLSILGYAVSNFRDQYVAPPGVCALYALINEAEKIEQKNTPLINVQARAIYTSKNSNSIVHI